MAYLHMNFKFREPYQVLVDEEIVLEAVKTRFDLAKGLERTVQGKVKPMITQCAMEALYRTKNQEAIGLAKNFERRRCNHLPRKAPREEETGNDGSDDDDSEDQTEAPKEDKKKDEESGPKSAFDCIYAVVNIKGKNKHRYVVATQKVGLRGVLRKIPAVPLIYINRSVMIMEPMSPATENARETIEREKLTSGLNNPLNDIDESQETTGKKRKKGPKEPNPLSIKKKKVENEDKPSTGQDSGAPKKRVRRHKRKQTANENANNENVNVSEGGTNGRNGGSEEE